MNKIIITGSSGKLGNHLVNSLSNDFKIFHFGRKKRKFDLTKKKKFENYILQIKPDFIINCAAITDIETCEFKKKYTEKVNVGIVKNLIDTKNRFNLSFKLIQISTDQMYDSSNVIKNHENQKSVINNNYTRQKLQAERISLKNNSIILRTNFFGFSNSGNNQTFTDWLYTEASRNSYIKLFNDVKFNPLSLITLSEIIKKIIKKNNKKIYGIYNLGSKSGLSKEKFALKFLKKFKKLNYKSVSVNSVLKVKRSKNMIMNINKIQKKLNVKLPDINDEIRKEIKNYNNNRFT